MRKVHSLSAPGGGEGWGEVGDFRAPSDTHLTLPSLRDGPLPLPPEGRRGDYSSRLRRSAPAGPAVRAARADRGVVAVARRPALSLYLAAMRASGAARRWSRAHRRGVVDRRVGPLARGDPRLLPGRGRRGAAILAVPRRALWLAAAALVRPWPLCLRHAMPELPPKGFDRLSRTIGTGGDALPGKGRTLATGGN